jgi:uncharacterized cupin superfamily protein
VQGLILRRKEKHYEAQGAKIKVDYLTDHGQYHAAHWHNELEMIYLLNGNAKIVLDGQSEIPMRGVSSIQFMMSSEKARLIRFKNDFYSRVREKLVNGE